MMSSNNSGILTNHGAGLGSQNQNPLPFFPVPLVRLPEFRWNLALLLGRGFPDGILLHTLSDRYYTYFKQRVEPQDFHPSALEWKQVFIDSLSLRNTFKVHGNRIKLSQASVLNTELEVVLKLANYKEYMDYKTSAILGQCQHRAVDSPVSLSSTQSLPTIVEQEEQQGQSNGASDDAGTIEAHTSVSSPNSDQVDPLAEAPAVSAIGIGDSSSPSNAVTSSSQLVVPEIEPRADNEDQGSQSLHIAALAQAITSHLDLIRFPSTSQEVESHISTHVLVEQNDTPPVRSPNAICHGSTTPESLMDVFLNDCPNPPNTNNDHESNDESEEVDIMAVDDADEPEQTPSRTSTSGNTGVNVDDGEIPSTSRTSNSPAVKRSMTSQNPNLRCSSPPLATRSKRSRLEPQNPCREPLIVTNEHFMTRVKDIMVMLSCKIESMLDNPELLIENDLTLTQSTITERMRTIEDWIVYPVTGEQLQSEPNTQFSRGFYVYSSPPYQPYYYSGVCNEFIPVKYQYKKKGPKYELRLPPFTLVYGEFVSDTCFNVIDCAILQGSVISELSFEERYELTEAAMNEFNSPHLPPIAIRMKHYSTLLEMQTEIIDKVAVRPQESEDPDRRIYIFSPENHDDYEIVGLLFLKIFDSRLPTGFDHAMTHRYMWKWMSELAVLPALPDASNLGEVTLWHFQDLIDTESLKSALSQSMIQY